MEPERWKKIEELYQAAMAQPSEKRADILQRACSGDPELRAEVESLLEAAGSASSFLEGSPLSGEAGADTTSGPTAGGPGRIHGILPDAMSPDEVAGTVIGRYHLLQKIGEGGMGEVWLAEQKEPVRRRVALKLVKAGMNSREVIARFESERQALALMDHPAIAKVFDAGSTPEGAPYFVMEYVAGVPITTYCDSHRLNTRERLDLFIRVCEGVQHAHQKAIIHRDLKPSNILVLDVDGRAAPKIIDFGVAKALTQKLTADTMFTRVGMLLGTPQYMSPEQADSSGEDIDTRTDVYSLGIILYELLAGVPPLDMRRIAFDEFLRKLREEEPPKPSTKIRTQDAAASTTLAHKRQTEPLALAKEIRGDLDSITLKALEKDRSRRYGSPAELAADIRRYLRHEPVEARPASAGYRAGKYIRRHRIGVVFAAGVALLLAGFAVAQALQLQRIKRERDRADRIASFVTDMFKVSNPSEARGNQVTAREILDKASGNITAGLVSDPLFQAQMMQVMGEVYVNLGLFSRAESLLRQVAQIRTRLLGLDDPGTLQAMHALAVNLYEQGRYADTEKLLGQTIEIERRVMGPEQTTTLSSMNTLANAFIADGRYAEAEALHRQVLDIRRRTLGADDPSTMASLSNLAVCVREQKRYAEAETLDRQAVEIWRRTMGPDHPNTLKAMDNLATDLEKEDRYPEAEQLYRQALGVERRVLGPDHPQTLRSLNNLANLLMDMRQYAKADEQLLEVRDIQRRTLGPDHPDTALSTYNLACVAAHRGDSAGAMSLLSEALDHGLRQADADAIASDPDLQSLHSDPHFAALVASVHQRAGSPKKPE
jgi:eukaryotic-like serine/threonine-protein kinase